MADFSALKQSIQNYIKQNGNKEITGAILQNILLSMVTTMGDGAINDNASNISNLNGNLSNEVNRAKGAETTTLLFSDGKLVFKNAAGTVLYQLSVDSFLSAITTRLNTGALYAGYATPSTTPATLTNQEVFYLATQAGTYTNFHFNGGDDPIVLTKDGIYFIVSGTDDDDWNAEPMLQLDDVPTAGSDNPVKSGGVAEELALGAVYDVSAKNPTAGPNSDGKWESLSALLSDANLSTLIPTSVRKGGMSIKFVSSVDNKYVQYRLMATLFSTDTDDWALCSDSVLVDNPEFIEVETDKDGKILWAIKIDGGIYYGAGCPQQVKDYIEEKISSLSLDEYEDIVAFLSDYLRSDTTLKVLIDSKLDAEGLDPNALETVQAVENPEYIQVTTDSEDNILEGITEKGVKQINLPIDTPSVTVEHVENPEWLEVKTDSNGNVLQGIDKDGDTIIKGINLTTLKNTLDDLSVKVNNKTITKLCLPELFTFELGKSYQLFKRSMFKGIDYRNYDIQVIFPNSSTQQEVESCKDYDRYVQYTPVSTGDINVRFLLLDTNRNLLDEKNVVFKTIQRNTQPSTMQTVLFIGDSLTAYNRISDEFYRLLTSNDESSTVQDTLSIYNVKKPAGRNWGNIELIGTQKNDYLGWVGQTYNEGYSGWKWYHFIHSGSPFVINGQIDFNGYLTSNNFNTPNIVYVGLGWNDAINDAIVKDNGKEIDISAIMTNARTFLNAITSQLPNTKIRLWTENITGVHGGIGNNTKSSTERFDEYLLNLIQFEIMEGYKTLILDYPNVDIVWSTAFFDSEYCLQEEEADINTRISNKEVRGKDYIHPADSGFFQIADSLVTDFCSLL